MDHEDDEESQRNGNNEDDENHSSHDNCVKQLRKIKVGTYQVNKQKFGSRCRTCQ